MSSEFYHLISEASPEEAEHALKAQKPSSSTSGKKASSRTRKSKAQGKAGATVLTVGNTCATTSSVKAGDGSPSDQPLQPPLDPPRGKRSGCQVKVKVKTTLFISKEQLAAVGDCGLSSSFL
jgi:hypothetical protein